MRAAHYRLDEVTFLPRPVQRPRIPIWVGGAYPNRGPMRRAARWDGVCLYRRPDGGRSQTMLPEDVRRLKAFCERERASAEAFDVVVYGGSRGPDGGPERGQVEACAEAGATWWEEWIPPGEPAVMRAAIARGPVRVD